MTILGLNIGVLPFVVCALLSVARQQQISDYFAQSAMSALGHKQSPKLYHLSGCFRAYTGRSEADFRELQFERLLPSKAAVQIARN
jgi:hypothetical protein